MTHDDVEHLEVLLLGIEPVLARHDALSKLPAIAFALCERMLFPVEARPRDVEQLSAIWARIQAKRKEKAK